MINNNNSNNTIAFALKTIMTMIINKKRSVTFPTSQKCKSQVEIPSHPRNCAKIFNVSFNRQCKRKS